MLRWRLSLGMVTLMALLLAVGCYAVWLLDSLGPAVKRVLDNNYRAIKAIEDIRVATLRINSTYFSPSPEALPSFDKAAFDDNHRAIDAAVEELRSVPMPAAESEAARRLDGALDTYLRLYGRLFAASTRDKTESLLMMQRIQDSTLLISEAADRLLSFNEEAMLDADRKARQHAKDSIHFLLLAMGLALAVAIYASYRMGSAVLEPIRVLTDFTGRIGSGQLDISAPVLSEDELGKLASSFNTMAAQLRAYRQTTSERIFKLNHTMEATLSAFPDPIFVIDRERRITLRNPAALRFGEELGFGDGLPPEMADRITQALETGLDYLPSSFRDTLFYRVNEQEKSFLPRVLVMRGQHGEMDGLAVVLQDMTRFRLMDDVKTNLISTVSHELRTPLTSIRMAFHILMERKIGALTDKQADLLGVAREDAERLLRTLNDLLDLARLEDGRHNLHYDLVAPEELGREVVQEAESAADRHHVRLVIEAGKEGLPSMMIDRARVKHVLAHFLDNAIKHSPSGATVRLGIERRPGDQIRFSVEDQGEGIPSEFQGRIFDKFFRVPGRPKTGAGIGLSIARQIVQAHLGRIGVHSGAQGGSEFYCELPLDGKN
ncbi:MAG: ATP-binding protein [Verrucomicrobium sp.]|nr:ATP-binding protein [Verrucomicrobium sp.]